VTKIAMIIDRKARIGQEKTS